MNDPAIKISTTDTGWSRDQYVERLDEGLEWIRSFGIRVSVHGRHMKYRKLLVKYATHNPGTADGSWGIEQTSNIVNAKLETHELDRIRRQFIINCPLGLVDKLRALVNGPTHYRDEIDRRGASKFARNTATELSFGAYMNRHGFSVEYGDSDFPEPMISVSNRDYAVQCKRIGSTKIRTTIDAMKTASRQISLNIEKLPNIQAGISVFDISKLVNPLGKVLFCESDKNYVNSEARFRMHKFFGEFVNGYPFWEFPQTIGIVVSASFIRTEDPSSSFDSFMCHKLIKNAPGHTFLTDHLNDKFTDKEYVVNTREFNSNTWFS